MALAAESPDDLYGVTSGAGLPAVSVSGEACERGEAAPCRHNTATH